MVEFKEYLNNQNKIMKKYKKLSFNILKAY